jgi:hypothetical protein
LFGFHVEALAGKPAGIEITFSGMWWSEDQLNGLDEKHPPPMATRIKLDQWIDDFDNVWPPHPDLVDVDVTLKGVHGSAKTPVRATYQLSFKGHFTAPKPLFNKMVDLSSGSERSVRGTINVMKYISYRRWPDRLRVRVNVGTQSPAIADLPVEIGD